MIDQKIIEGDFNSDFRKLFRIKGFFLPAKLFSVAEKKKKSHFCDFRFRHMQSDADKAAPIELKQINHNNTEASKGN